MITADSASTTNNSLANISGDFLWASALVLTLAMLAFAFDLAGHPARAARAARRAETPAETAAQTAVGASSAGGVATMAPAEVDAAREKRQWGGIGMSLSWLGGALLIASVVTRALAVSRPPLGNMYEFACVGAMFVMIAFLGWSLKRDLRWLGLFVVGLVVLVEMLAATVYYTAASQLMPSLKSYWLSIHVTVATISVALFTIAFAVTCLYLLQDWREKKAPHKLSWMGAVPGASTLDRTAYGILIIAFPLWTFTLIAGAIWAQEAWGHYWNWDPKEVWTLVIWVVYAAYLHARITVGWGGRKAAYISLAGFACVLINYGIVNVYFVGQHSYSGM